MTKENSTFMAEFACSDARKIADKSNSKLLETLLEKFKNMTTAGCKSLAIFDIDSNALVYFINEIQDEFLLKKKLP